MRQPQHQHVRQLLDPCPKDHRKDADWRESRVKMLCTFGKCQIPLCEDCAAAVAPHTNEKDYPYRLTYRIRLWCREHADAMEEGAG